MANHRRGEIEAELGGRRYTLCLTLGALAELEAAFGSHDLVDLAGRFENGRLSARDILRIIGCGLRGAGNLVSDAELATFPVAEGLRGYARIAAELLAATFGQETGEVTGEETAEAPVERPVGDVPPAFPPPPQDARF